MTKISSEKINYIKLTETFLAIIAIRQVGILEIRFKKEQYEVGLEEQKAIEEAVLSLTNYGRESFHILVVPGRYGSINKEAREREMFKSPAYENQKSMAIVVHSLSQRILAKAFFLLKSQKPNYPYGYFESEKEAVKWLKQLQAEKR